ncbi:N-6 DNA methylase [Clostridium cochlearium]|uniref:N-6 DNA methylase n=1 Tax=Clostridium cochlearium TaxID=1494 RepID=UPI001C0EB44B|nr:N-6 DNA methylase [Clostridium cochlearium]MBU5270307.1 N-6 DNA methylase [Clostridium cochlearium]
MNEKRELLIYSCFEHLRGVFSQQQAFSITLGVATVKWMEQTNKYAYSSKLISKALLDNAYLESEVERHESEFPEFRGILSVLLSRTFENTGDYLKEIYWRMSDEEDFRELINKTVHFGIRESDFNQTPNSIARFVAKLQDLNIINSFADYCAGVSSIALEIFRQTSHQPYYYAEEINTTIWLISKLLMIVNDVENYEIVNTDVFRKGDINDPKLFDLVVSDIPRISKYNRAFSLNDPRFKYGAPGKGNQEWAFIQNVIYHLNNRGKGIIIGSKGMLVRGYESQIRAAIIKEDLIECVITLPDNLYQGTNIGTEVMILNRNKPAERKGGILFINAHSYRERLNRYQHTLTEEGAERIIRAYYRNIEEEGFSKFIPIEKTKEYDYRLNPVEYIDFESLKNLFDRTVSLDEIAEITRGVSVSKKDMESLEIGGEYYYISIKNIDEGSINYEDATKIRPKSGDWLEKYSIEPEDILITTKGWETKVALVGNDVRDAFFSSNLTRIRVDRRKYNPYILAEFLQSEIGKKMLESIQTGTTITLINNKQLSRMEVPVYSNEVMAEIGQKMEENQKLYEERVRLAEQEYEETRVELMNRLGL